MMDKQKIELGVTAAAIVFLLALVAGNLKKKPSKELGRTAGPSPGTLSSPGSAPIENPAQSTAAADEKELALQKERAKLAWGPDPFNTLNTNKEYRKGNLKLKGISFGQDKRGFAFINNEIVQKGDRVEDYEVLEVEKDKVLLKKQDQSFYLALPQE